jgi:hypothetical protein
MKGAADIYQLIPTLKKKTAPVYGSVHLNVMAKNSTLVQTQIEKSLLPQVPRFPEAEIISFKPGSGKLGICGRKT